MLSPDLIKDITNGFHKIDLERDDILIKFERDWTMPEEYVELSLSENIHKQIEVGLPLSAMQIEKIERHFWQELQRKRKQKEMENLVRSREQRARKYSSPAYLTSTTANEGTESITYEAVLSRHLENLRQIRENEHRIISPLMQTKWQGVQQMIKDLRRQQTFDYSKFLTQMFDVLYYLNLY
jgi:hypothetical protein